MTEWEQQIVATVAELVADDPADADQMIRVLKWNPFADANHDVEVLKAVAAKWDTRMQTRFTNHVYGLQWPRVCETGPRYPGLAYRRGDWATAAALTLWETA